MDSSSAQHSRPPSAARALSESVFSDIDEQAAALRGWNQRYLQLSAGKFQGSVQRLELDGVGLFIEDLQQAVHQTGQVRPEVVALGVPVVLQGDSQFCGQPGDGSALHVFSGANGFEFRSPLRHVMLGIEVDTALFDTQVLDVAHHDARSFTATARLHTAQPAAISGLRRFLLGLFAAAEHHTAHTPRAQVRDELLGHLAAAVAPASSNPHHQQPLRCAAQAALAQRALQLAAQRLDNPPTVAELCQALGVSRRTLQNCFHATWGMGPLAWLNVLRLNLVRSRLKTAESVTEAATQLGFWHFGHFAHSYHALFGELPSQTLRRHRDNAPALRH
jgi:AraC family transcriptional regulator, ethanolamine operon transcriptional activator